MNPKMLRAMAFPIFMLLAWLVVMALLLRMIAKKGRGVRDTASAAFAPLGIVGRKHLLVSWKGGGSVQGRNIQITVAGGTNRSPQSMFLELASHARFEITFGPPMPSAGAWLRSMIRSGAEVHAPSITPWSVYTPDAARAVAVANAARAAIVRILAPTVQGQTRYVFVRQGVIKLHVVGAAVASLNAESARRDIEDLITIAESAERA